MSNLFKALSCLLLLSNALGLLLMCLDKHFAKKHLRRISENTLMLVAILGGSVGSLAGMHLFHHKTRKRKFSVGIPVILTLQAALAIFLWFR